MDDSLISFAMWRRAPGSVRLATLLLVASGLINCIHDFTPVMRASHLSPPAELRGILRLGVALFWALLVTSLQPWAWVLVLAACLVPLPVMLYLLKQQMSGVIPHVLGQMAPVGAISVVTAALDLTVAGLLLLASSRAALRSPQPPGF